MLIDCKLNGGWGGAGNEQMWLRLPGLPEPPLFLDFSAILLLCFKRYDVISML